MITEELSKFIDKRVRVRSRDGKSYEGVGWEIIYGIDKSEEALDYAIDSLLIKIEAGRWAEFIPGDGDSIELL